jgi:hypothetical protein
MFTFEELCDRPLGAGKPGRGGEELVCATEGSGRFICEAAPLQLPSPFTLAGGVPPLAIPICPQAPDIPSTLAHSLL